MPAPSSRHHRALGASAALSAGRMRAVRRRLPRRLRAARLRQRPGARRGRETGRRKSLTASTKSTSSASATARKGSRGARGGRESTRPRRRRRPRDAPARGRGDAKRAEQKRARAPPQAARDRTNRAPPARAAASRAANPSASTRIGIVLERESPRRPAAPNPARLVGHHLAVMSDEAIERFACFGGSCGVIVAGDAPARSGPRAAAEHVTSCSRGTSASRASCPAASSRA